jgi:hypothetical protein
MGGVLLFTVALPLALSNPFPTPKNNDWVIQPAAPGPYQLASLGSVRIEAPSTVEPAMPEPSQIEESPAVQAGVEPSVAPSNPAQSSVVEETPPPARSAKLQDRVEMTSSVVRVAAREPSMTVRFSFAERWSLTTTPVEVASSASMPAEVARLETPEPHGALAPAPAPRRTANTMEEIDRYLWEVYQRKPNKVDSSGDFTWKDPAAAKHMGKTMPEYVIGGMDADFREQLYHAGQAMDGSGLSWSMLSAFRDDYRQGLASGYKAHGGNSKHGGSRATGGYGHGQAIDITSAEGDDGAIWHWIDAHGAKYGLRRPIPGRDPAHVQAQGKWHEIALALRNNRSKVASQEAATKVAKVSR